MIYGIIKATFQYNNVLAALDILVKDEEGWKAYEVKSSTKVSETYIKDAAVTSELIEIEEKLEDFKIKISNLDKKVSELIEFSKNLSNIWVSGEYETKLSVQKLLFPEGIVIDPEDRTYRTSNLNPIFGLIHSFTGGDDSGNKKRTGRNTDPSSVVDNSIEISNISFTPKDLIDAHNLMTLIMKEQRCCVI